jgi:hypothetical protein
MFEYLFLFTILTLILRYDNINTQRQIQKRTNKKIMDSMNHNIVRCIKPGIEI